MREPVLPNFLIVGTGKAGTTSLYHYLRQHPQIYMSPIKEPCFFSDEVRAENLTDFHLRHIRRQSRKLPSRTPTGWLVKTWDDYVRLFQDVKTETAIGEASVVYLWSETAADNIMSRIPDTKIIMMLRDPAERAFSQYFHQLAAGLMSSSFREHIDMCLRNQDHRISPHYPFLEVGFYYEQVKRYLTRFPRENIRIYWYEEAWKQPDRLFRDLFEFLSVDATFRPDTSQRSLERTAPRFPRLNRATKRFELAHRLNELVPMTIRRPIRRALFRNGRGGSMSPEDRQFLIDYYHDDIMKLSALLNRDLTHWLSPMPGTGVEPVRPLRGSGF